MVMLVVGYKWERGLSATKLWGRTHQHHHCQRGKLFSLYTTVQVGKKMEKNVYSCLSRSLCSCTYFPIFFLHQHFFPQALSLSVQLASFFSPFFFYYFTAFMPPFLHVSLYLLPANPPRPRKRGIVSNSNNWTRGYHASNMPFHRANFYIFLYIN